MARGGFGYDPLSVWERTPTRQTVYVHGRALNLQGIARVTRTDHGYLSRIFRGKTRPSYATLQRIASALGWSTDHLVRGIADRTAASPPAQ